MNIKRVFRKTWAILTDWALDPLLFCSVFKVFWAVNMLVFCLNDNVAGMAVAAFFYLCTTIEHHAYYTAPVRREGVLVIRTVSSDEPETQEESK